MSRAWFAIPGDLDLPTGGYRYGRRVLAEIANAVRPGFELVHLPLPGGYPFPSKAELSKTRSQLTELPSGATVLIDGLALGAMPPTLITDLNLDVVALVHHPLGFEAGLSDSQSKDLLHNETSVLKLVREVIVTSPATKSQLVASLGVQAENIAVALPGLERPTRHKDLSNTSTVLQSDTETVKILSVGSITPRKGHDILIDALGELRELRWECRIVGITPDGSTLDDDLKIQAGEKGIADRITFVGGLSETALEDQYLWADVFALLTRYEGFGMAFAEAMIYRLPVVAGAGGAVPDTVPENAGALIPVDDRAAATAALKRLIQDPDARAQAGHNARRRAEEFPTWSDTACLIADVLLKRPEA